MSGFQRSARSRSFGKRSQGCGRPANLCIPLNPSDMIGISCADEQAETESQLEKSCLCSSVEGAGSQDIYHHDLHSTLCRMSTDSGLEQRVDGVVGGGVGVGVSRPSGLSMLQEPFVGRDKLTKRSSRASDSSSAYSGSDMMHSSLDDPANSEADMTGLMESVVDSDEEEGYAESTDSFPIRDTVRDCLEKDPSERTDDDIEILMDFMQHFKAFGSLSHMTRQALCAVMVFAVVPHEGTVVMKDGEELDSWSVILNGEVEVVQLDGKRTLLQMGDAFGITPTMQKMYHKGIMRTLTDDCQFVCIAQQHYYRILHQEEENTRKHEEQGQVVMVTELREFDGGNKRGHIVIRGKAERLMKHLVDDHSTLDPTYVEDFLLTYRTFLPSSVHLANKLLHWFNDPQLRPKVTRVVLLWVNNHFNDFETNPAMCEFLEQFECLLERESETDFERMMGQITMLNMACAAKAKVRMVTLTRASRDEPLPFSILGGQERGQGIFITKVTKDTKAEEEGLKRGDQILEVNGQKFTEIFSSKALDILQGSTHLSISVKSNLQDFKEMLRSAEKSTPRKLKQQRDENTMSTLAKYRLSVPDLNTTLSYITTTTTTSDTAGGKGGEERKGSKGLFFGLTAKPRIKKALEKMSIFPAFVSNSINHSDESLNLKPSRKSSSSSSSSSNTGPSNHLSASNPDLSTLTLGVYDRPDFPEHVIKVFRADQSFKFLLIQKETTAKEVVMLALQEFGITESSGNYALCELTVESENCIKRRTLPDIVNNLPDRLNLKGRCSVPRVHRFYLKSILNTEALIPDEMIGELLKESQIVLLQLNATEVAWQLTLEDFKVFRDIEPTEYIDDLFQLHSKYGCPLKHKFTELVNREMFWVVTEICGEPNVVRRMKLIKHFIKIAKCCKDYKNFNSMFNIMSGLMHGSVSRLRSTWEKLPNKYWKMFEDLQTLMDPSRNMTKYRSLLNSEHIQPPVIPIFPVVNKDLTFIHLGNDSDVEGLVNFEKLRMIAKEIRHITHFCSSRYDVSSSSMLLSTQAMFGSSLVSGMATLRRTKYRRGSTLPNPKKMYEEAQMVRKVRSYLSTMPAITNEEELAEMSNQCEHPARKRDPSPGGSNSPNLEEKRVVVTGPKFGAESPGAVRKIMALTDKVRPHNSKVPVPSSPRRQGPPSPGHIPWAGSQGGQCRLLPVRLTYESSSVTSVLNNPPRRPRQPGSVGAIELFADTVPPSGRSSSVSHPNPHPAVCVSGPSPTALHFAQLPWQQAGTMGSSSRPQLPSYSTVMHNATITTPPVSSHPPQPGFVPPHPPPPLPPPAAGGRPPLPDYQSAAYMAQLARQNHNMAGGHPAACYRATHTDIEEEQVSAV